MERAIARGISARQKIMKAEGGSISVEMVAQKLSISKTKVLERYHASRLIGWPDERQKTVRFPIWQFEDEVLNGLEEVLEILNAGSRLDDFGRMLFFLSSQGFLGGQRPLDYLRAGKVDKVLQAAESYGG